MKCENCGAETDILVTNFEVTDESTTQSYLCESCLRDIGVDTPSEEQMVLEKVPKLRALVSFIRQNNRMPSSTELSQFGGAGDLSSTLPGTVEFDRAIKYFDELADFIERTRRFPTEAELPDPF